MGKLFKKQKTFERDEKKTDETKKMRILFFLESLQCGGKERRSLELIRFLKQQTDYAIELVLTDDEIYYEDVYELGIRIRIIKRSGIKYDPGLFLKFYRIARSFKPDIIHAWGKMTTFYAIPTKLICRIPLISSLIADSNKTYKKISPYTYLLKTNIFFSDVILSNSKAGLLAYDVRTEKAKVIYNGVYLERFQKNYNTTKVREELGVKSEFMLVMVATFSKFKDYDLFINVAKEIQKLREDVTFVGVGDGSEWERIDKRIKEEHINNVILTGIQKEVERIVASSDIGILCSISEGMSNSIIEYMALGKPVISTDLTGGSKELIIDGETGYIFDRNREKIIETINNLLDNKALRVSMGNRGRIRIHTWFSINRMGDEFRNLYQNVSDQKEDRNSKAV